MFLLDRMLNFLYLHTQNMCVYFLKLSDLMRKALYLLLVAAFFVGCSKEKKEEVTGPYIFFETKVGDKGTLPQGEGETFGVAGYFAAGESLNKVFVDYDDKVAKVSWNAEDGAFTYDRLASWTDGTYSFYAYYPYYYKDRSRISVIDDMRSMTLKFIQPDSLEDMVDFMTASVEDLTKTPQAVTLPFKSRLFGVDVIVRNDDDAASGNAGIVIDKAEITFMSVPQSLELELDGKDYFQSEQTIDIYADLLEGTTGFLLEPGADYNFTEELGNSFFLIPEQSIKYAVTLEYTDPSGETNVYTYPEDGGWAQFGENMEAGKRYAIVLATTLGSPYDFSASVEDWEETVDIEIELN